GRAGGHCISLWVPALRQPCHANRDRNAGGVGGVDPAGWGSVGEGLEQALKPSPYWSERPRTGLSPSATPVPVPAARTSTPAPGDIAFPAGSEPARPARSPRRAPACPCC